MYSKETVIIGFFLASVFSFALGILVCGVYFELPGKFDWVDVLTVGGAWASAVGTIVAVLVALRISREQQINESIQDAVRCTHHSVTVVQDIRGRLTLVAHMLTSGGWTVSAFVANVEFIERRYEALLDRDVFRHASQAWVNRLLLLSGMVFGLSALSQRIQHEMSVKDIALLPPKTGGAGIELANKIQDIDQTLVNLIDDILEVRAELDKLTK